MTFQHRLLNLKCLLIIILIFQVQFSLATQLVISFNEANPAFPTNCEDSWMEEGVSLQIDDFSAQTNCNFSFSNGILYAASSILSADLSGLGFINQIEVDIRPNCADLAVRQNEENQLSNLSEQVTERQDVSLFACMQADFFAGLNLVASAANTNAITETLLFENINNLPVDNIKVQSFEGEIREIRIDYTSRPINEEKIELNFDNANPALPNNCGETWVEEGISLQIDNYDNLPNCNFLFNNNAVQLSPAQLSLDLSSLGFISQIAIDIKNNCGDIVTNRSTFATGCTEAEFLASSSIVETVENTGFGAETLFFTNTNNVQIDNMNVKAFNSEISEIRICYISTAQACQVIPNISADAGDVYVSGTCNGVVLTSPNGMCFRMRVDNNGAFISEAVPCPGD